MRESIMTAKTVDEALRKAKEELNVTTQDTGFEILQMPRRGFLGLKNTPARVRVYMMDEEEAPAEEKVTPPPVRAAERPVYPKEAPASRGVQARQTTTEKQREPVVERVTTPRVETSTETPSVQRPRQERSTSPQVRPDRRGAFVATPEDQLSDKAKTAVSYIRDILESMGVTKAVVTARQTKESIDILLEGDGLGVIIGRRGETLDAVQYLTSLVANRVDGEYVRISIDSGDYRKKRAETLERLAQKLARSAVKTGRSTKLEPMNPYERRIIHAAVSRIEGATSSSIGEEPNRRVVISSKAARKRPEGVEAPRENREIPTPPVTQESAEMREARQPKESRPFPASRGGRGYRERDGVSPPRQGRFPAGNRTSGTKPAVKISDSEIEIPKDLAPKDLPPAKPAPVKAQEDPRTPSPQEKEALPLYGKLDME